MFKLNKVIKTKKGELVKPFAVQGDTVYCFDKNGETIRRNVSEFDFTKEEEKEILEAMPSKQVVVDEDKNEDQLFEEDDKDDDLVFEDDEEEEEEDKEKEEQEEEDEEKDKDDDEEDEDDDPWSDDNYI